MAHVLFVCLQNAGRSQMSEALFGLAGSSGGAHTAESAGTTRACFAEVSWLCWLPQSTLSSSRCVHSALPGAGSPAGPVQSARSWAPARAVPRTAQSRIAAAATAAVRVHLGVARPQKTTVFDPSSSTRSSRCQRTAR
ncbi:MAG: hypothetical protein WKF96_18580, partial [Solirubrobacteraceae bacterium]